MIDAYTIGITLALNDGVSAGIEQIRRDLLLLDQAIAQTAAELGTLQHLGQQAGLPQLPQPARPGGAQPPQQPKRDADPTDAPAAAPMAPTPIREKAPQSNEPRRAIETAASGRPQATETPFSAIAAALVGGQPRDIARNTDYSAQAPRPLAQPEAALVRLSAANDQPSAAASRDLPRAPVPMAWIPLTIKNTEIPDFAAFAPQMSAPTEGGDATWRDSISVVASTTPPQSELSLASASSKTSGPPEFQHVPSSPIEWRPPVPEIGANRDSSAPSAPLSFGPDWPPRNPMAPTPQVSGRETTSPQLFDRADIQQSAEQTNPNGAGRSTSDCTAEILVDGRMLGRVVSDQLAAQLIRPQHGFTGIDPRAVPTWPGASVG